MSEPDNYCPALIINNRGEVIIMTILSHLYDKTETQILLEDILKRTESWPREHLYDAMGMSDIRLKLIHGGYDAGPKTHQKLLNFKSMLDKYEASVTYTAENNFPSFDHRDFLSINNQKGV